MTVDTRKIFNVKRPKKSSVREEFAKQIALNWLQAHTTAERDGVKQLTQSIQRKDNICYVIALATAIIAKVDMEKARWFADFLA